MDSESDESEEEEEESNYEEEDESDKVNESESEEEKKEEEEVKPVKRVAETTEKPEKEQKKEEKKQKKEEKKQKKEEKKEEKKQEKKEKKEEKKEEKKQKKEEKKQEEEKQEEKKPRAPIVRPDFSKLVLENTMYGPHWQEHSIASFRTFPLRSPRKRSRASSALLVPSRWFIWRETPMVVWLVMGMCGKSQQWSNELVWSSSRTPRSFLRPLRWLERKYAIYDAVWRSHFV